MAERFKVDVFALEYAKEIGELLETIRWRLESAVRMDNPMTAAIITREAGKQCRKLSDCLRSLEDLFAGEIPREKPQLRSVGEK